MSVLPLVGEREAFVELSRFRTSFYGCLSARADAFFELTDALLCGRADEDAGGAVSARPCLIMIL